MSNPENILRKANQLNGLSPAALAFLLPELLGENGRLRTVLLAPDEAAADRLADDLEFFSRFRSGAWGKIARLRLGGWEHSPYRHLQPGLSARLE